MLPTLFLLSAGWAVSSFTHRPSSICRPSAPLPGSRCLASSWTLHAAKKRGGAMARRKKAAPSSSKGGFDRQSNDESSVPSMKSGEIYSMPPLYDLAFGYRSYEDEVDFLLETHDRYSTRSPGDAALRILELAAGPARHSLAALSERPPSEVDSVVALDLSPSMVAYGLENADHELGAPGGRRDDFDYVQGDMRNIGECTSKEFDAAWILLGSLAHLVANDDVIACFASIHTILAPGGTVVVELPHPRETFSMGECTRNGWTVPLVEEGGNGEEREYGELDIVWGDEDDEFDPVAQVRQFTVGMELKVNDVDDIPKDENASPLFAQMSEDGKTSVREVVPMRLFTLQEIDALARCAGFEVVARYGALDDVSIDSEEDAFRMVCVLRKAEK